MSTPVVRGAPDETRDLVQEELEITGSEERALEFDVEHPAQLAVLSADGQPVAKARLTLVLENGSAAARGD
jgi:hypothetical protein